MKIVIPMAGQGSRFIKAGYNLPKPLIDVEGAPMIQRVIENLNFDASYVFIVRQEHLRDYNLESVLKEATNNNYQIVPVDKVTEGAACTVLLAEKYIDISEDIMISNCDEVMEYAEQVLDSKNKTIDGLAKLADEAIEELQKIKKMVSGEQNYEQTRTYKTRT